MIMNMLPVHRAFGLVAINHTVSPSNVDEVFAADETLLDDRYLRRIEAFLDELIWTAKTLRHGRERLPGQVSGS